jgi:hypothetical protein
MANKLLNFRCPEPLLDAIDEFGREHYPADNPSGCDRSKALIDIVTAGIQALTDGTVILPRAGSVRQPSDSEIKAMVEAAIEEKLGQTPVQTPVQIPPNIPTQNQFHELKERVNDFRGSLQREIQNRDKGISLLAEQVAELTARLDNMPVPGIDKETLETAKSTVLRNWRLARSPEKKERIELALDKFIDIVSPPPTNVPEIVPEIVEEVIQKKGKEKVKKEGIKKDLELDLEIDEDDKIPKSIWKDWEQVCTDTITDLREMWREK